MNLHQLFSSCLFLMFFSPLAYGNSILVSNANDTGSGSLRFAIDSLAMEGDTISFAPEVSEIILQSELVLSQSLIILGRGVDSLSLSGNNTTRIFRITGGNIHIKKLRLINGNADQEGGGILKENGFLFLQEAILDSCSAGVEGGALYNKSGDILVSEVIFRNNSSFFGGALFHKEGKANLMKVILEMNEASLGGAISNSGDLYIEQSSILLNAASAFGGGIYSNSGTIILESDIVSGNEAEENLGGGIYHSGGDLLMVNSVVSGNAANKDGGGIYHKDGNLRITNSTITANRANEEGGGIHASNNMDLINSILWANNSQLAGVAGANINFSIIQDGGFPGESNLEEDPRFITPANPVEAPTISGDFRLTLNSPGIDAGTLDTTGLSLPALDLEGSPRLLDRVDIGAYENTICGRPYLYFTDFEAGNQGWRTFTHSDADIWALGTPNGSLISEAASGENAWHTDLTNIEFSENYFVLSPCFDFTEAVRPMLSFQYFSNSIATVEGAVIQYLLNNGINGETWQTLGPESELGLNWYDADDLDAAPADQPLGWTGTTEEWTTAAYALDDLNGVPIVHFRIAFSGISDNNDGFAFDDFSIAERSRTVLLEQFTSIDLPNAEIVHSTLGQYIADNQPDLAVIQYHWLDDIYSNYVNGPNLRYLLFYNGNDNQIPRTIIDGNAYDGPTLDDNDDPNWEGSQVNRAVLQPAFFSLDTSKTDICITATSPQELRIAVQIDQGENLPPEVLEAIEDDKIRILMAITEDSVLAGSDTLHHVLRQFLPGPNGEVFAGPSQLMEAQWSIPGYIQDPEQLKAVVFLQNDELDRTVYQSFSLDIPVNRRPVSADADLLIDTLFTYFFEPVDFPFTDPDGDLFERLEIVTLPGIGTLEFDGNPIGPNTIIPVDDIDLLSYSSGFLEDSVITHFTYRVSDGKDFSLLTYNFEIEIDIDAVNVTFQVDMCEVPNIHVLGVRLIGNFTDEDIMMTNIDGGLIYEHTEILTSNSTYNYRFKNGPVGIEQISGDCTNMDGDREITVGEDDVIIPVVCFRYCMPCLYDAVEETILAQSVSFFPNPFEDKINLRIDLPEVAEDLRIEVINSLGQVVYRLKLGQVMTYQSEINLEELPSGLYFLRVSDMEVGVSRRVVKE